LQRAKDRGLSRNDLSRNYGTPIVGETSDWWLNDLYKSALEEKDILQAFQDALTQKDVLEGQNGGGAGMTCMNLLQFEAKLLIKLGHMFPGGTGTSSRVVQGGSEGKEYTVGVLVQTNYGHNYALQIGGVPIGELLLAEGIGFGADPWKKKPIGKADDGSIVIILM
jgi:D-aminopeptidase